MSHPLIKKFRLNYRQDCGGVGYSKVKNGHKFVYLQHLHRHLFSITVYYPELKNVVETKKIVIYEDELEIFIDALVNLGLVKRTNFKPESEGEFEIWR